jgi:hypothetical protein
VTETTDKFVFINNKIFVLQKAPLRKFEKKACRKGENMCQPYEGQGICVWNILRTLLPQ